MQNQLTRRRVLQQLTALLPTAMLTRAAPLSALMQAAEAAPLNQAVLPSGVRARFIHNVNGIRMHVLEAGFERAGQPAVLLVHGFPELAFSWRKVMLPIAAAGYHVIAPDLRATGAAAAPT